MPHISKNTFVIDSSYDAEKIETLISSGVLKKPLALNFEGFRNFRLVMQVLENASFIYSLTFSNCKFTDFSESIAFINFIKDHIGILANLHEINFNEGEMQAAVFIGLLQYPEDLTHMTFISTKLTGNIKECLKFFAANLNLQNLRSLQLNCNASKDVAIILQFLINLHELRIFYAEDFELDFGTNFILPLLKKLHAHHITTENLSNILLAAPNLSTLSISGPLFSSFPSLPKFNLENLSCLRVYDSNDGLVKFQPLIATSKGLKILSFKRVNVRDLQLFIKDHLPKLKSLELTECTNVDPAIIEYLSTNYATLLLNIHGSNLDFSQRNATCAAILNVRQSSPDNTFPLTVLSSSSHISEAVHSPLTAMEVSTSGSKSPLLLLYPKIPTRRRQILPENPTVTTVKDPKCNVM